MGRAFLTPGACRKKPEGGREGKAGGRERHAVPVSCCRPGPISVGRPALFLHCRFIFLEASVLLPPVARSGSALQGSGAGSGGGSVLSPQPPPFLPLLLPPVGENWFYYDYFFFPFADLEEGCVREGGGKGRGSLWAGWGSSGHVGICYRWP